MLTSVLIFGSCVLVVMIGVVLRKNYALPAPAPEEQKQGEQKPEAQKPEGSKPEIKPETPPAEYYTTLGRKVGDFFIGVLGVMLVSAVVGFLFQMKLGGGGSAGGPVMVGTLFSAGMIIYLAILSGRRGRRFIGIGMISVFLIPLLLAGSCMIIMGIIMHK